MPKYFRVLFTKEKTKKPKWVDGFVIVNERGVSLHRAKEESNSNKARVGEEIDVDDRAFCECEKVRKRTKICQVLDRNEAKYYLGVRDAMVNGEECANFGGHRVQVDREIGACAVEEEMKMDNVVEARPRVVVVVPTHQTQNKPLSFRNPMFAAKEPIVLKPQTVMMSNAKIKRGREPEEKWNVAVKANRVHEMSIISPTNEESLNDEDVGTSEEKENDERSNKSPTISIAETFKKRLEGIRLEAEKARKRKELLEVAAADAMKQREEVAAVVEEEVIEEEEEVLLPPEEKLEQRQIITVVPKTSLHKVNYGGGQQSNIIEPSIDVDFPFEAVKLANNNIGSNNNNLLRFTRGVKEYQNYLVSASCEQLSLKLRYISDAVRSVVQSLPQQQTMRAMSSSIDPKNLSMRLGRNFRINYWSECKISAYKTSVKKDEDSGDVIPAKIVIELTLGKCEHSRPRDFSKGDVYVLSTDPGFFLSKSSKQGVDVYQNWTGVVASTWHAPDKDGKMHIEMLGALPRKLKEALSKSDSSWSKRKSVTVFAARAFSAFGELEEMKNAIEMVKSETMPLMQTILNPSAKETSVLVRDDDEEQDFEDLNFTLSLRYGLNHDQAVAMKGMLNDTGSSVHLVHGPYGSGKTKLITCYIREHVAREQKNSGKMVFDTKRNGRILVCANTNVAVDRVLKTLLESGFVDFCRVGSLAKIDADILPFSIHAKRDSKKGNTHIEELEKALENEKNISRQKRIEEEIRNLQVKGALQKRAKLVKSAPVVAVTCSSCVNKHLEDQRFDILILDECSQMTEICSLLPLARFGVKHLIAVGDPNQLPPVLESASGSCGGGLSASEQQPALFVRLAKLGMPVTLLRKQYRMHPVLSEIPNAQFYENKLEDGVLASDRDSLIPGVPPLVFFDTHGENARDERGQESKSKYNGAEAQSCAVIARELLKCGLKPRDIGIIAFYRSQVDCVNSLLEKMRVGVNISEESTQTEDDENGEIQVSTVDAFQGQEKKVIILTLCGAFKGSNSFTTRERLNVALTRAQSHEFIVADSKDIGQDWVPLKELLTLARKMPGGYHPPSRRIDDVVCKWHNSATIETTTTTAVDKEMKEEANDDNDDDVVCINDDDNLSSSTSEEEEEEEESDDDDESDMSDEHVKDSKARVEENIEFDMKEEDRSTGTFDEASLPNEYLSIIKVLETIALQPNEYYNWYKRLSKALLHRVEIDRRYCENAPDKRLRNVLSDLNYPGIPRSDATETAWNWSSKPLRKKVVQFFLPALSSYAHKHFGFEYTRLRFLIQKYDSIAELQIDQSGYGALVLHEADTQEKKERASRWLTRKLSLS